MKICYVCPDLGIPLDGHKGASAHVRSVVRALANLGHEVTVITPSPGTDESIGVPVVTVPVPKTAEDLGGGVEQRLARALRHIWTNVSVERILGEVLERERPDIVYERYSPFEVATSFAARRYGVPHILEVNAILSREGTDYRRQALGEVAQALEQEAFRTTSRIIAVSRALAQDLAASGVPEEKITVIPNGVDPQIFAPSGDTYRNGLGDRIVVGFVGSLKPWHGIDVLVAVFRELARDERYHLLVVGDGPERKALQALSDELPGRVTLTGAVAHVEVPRYLRAIDVAVAPYPSTDRFYFSPLKVLEYMASARAIVASRIGQLVDLIDDGETGLLVPPGDAATLIRSVSRLADDAVLREKLGSEALAVCRRNHSWGNRAAKIVELAENLR